MSALVEKIYDTLTVGQIIKIARILKEDSPSLRGKPAYVLVKEYIRDLASDGHTEADILESLPELLNR